LLRGARLAGRKKKREEEKKKEREKISLG